MGTLHEEFEASVQLIWEFADEGCKPGSDLRQDIELGKPLLLAAPDMLAALELIVEEYDALFLMTAFIINGKLVNPEEHIRALIAKAKGETA